MFSLLTDLTIFSFDFHQAASFSFWISTVYKEGHKIAAVKGLGESTLTSGESEKRKEMNNLYAERGNYYNTVKERNNLNMNRY